MLSRGWAADAGLLRGWPWPTRREGQPLRCHDPCSHRAGVATRADPPRLQYAATPLSPARTRSGGPGLRAIFSAHLGCAPSAPIRPASTWSPTANERGRGRAPKWRRLRLSNSGDGRRPTTSAPMCCGPRAGGAAEREAEFRPEGIVAPSTRRGRSTLSSVPCGAHARGPTLPSRCGSAEGCRRCQADDALWCRAKGRRAASARFDHLSPPFGGRGHRPDLRHGGSTCFTGSSTGQFRQRPASAVAARPSSRAPGRLVSTARPDLPDLVSLGLPARECRTG